MSGGTIELLLVVVTCYVLLLFAIIDYHQCHKLKKESLNGHRPAGTPVHSNSAQSPSSGWSGTGIIASRTILSSMGLSITAHPGRGAASGGVAGGGSTSAMGGHGYPAVAHEGIRAGEAIGWRCWIVRSDRLWSLTADIEWQPALPMAGDVSTFGVYALKDRGLAEAILVPDFGRALILGSVEMWGEIVEHEHGYRAQFAMVRSLDRMVGDGTHPDTLTRLREIYITAKEKQD